MKMFRAQFLILFIIYIRSSSCAFETVCDAGKKIWKLYSMIDNRTSTSDSYTAFSLYLKQMQLIHEQLYEMENSMNSKIIRNAFEAQPYHIMLYKSVDSLEIFILSIDRYYDEFRKIINKFNYYSEELGYFLKSVIQNIEEEIITVRRKVLQQIESLDQSLIFAITGHAVTRQPYLCNSPRIISQILFQLFEMIVIAEMKAHVMSAAARSYEDPQDVGQMNHLNRQKLKTQIELYMNVFLLNMPITDGVYLRACEPYHDHWIRDKSFYELEDTFGTAIFRYDWDKCDVDTCDNAWFKESQKCEARYYDYRTGCLGNLTDCIQLDAIHACVLRNSRYKFHHVYSDVEGLLGNRSRCPRFDSYMIEDGTSWNLSHSACACNCYGNDNKISLLIMESNVKSNMVITGLRFIRQDRILYIQLREGKLYANGRIRDYSQRWIPIPKNIPESQIHPINRENRVFFLDDLRLPSSFVLTGVKFNRVQRLSVIGFAIKIFGVPFNFKSGELNSDPNFVASKQASDNVLGEPLLFMTINPASATLPLKLSPADKKYVSLERSNLRDDFGQSTLPLFDAVPIITNPPLPLNGIGIFHKGADGYAGFISLRIYGLKYADFFTNFQATCMNNDKVLFDQNQ